MTKNNIGGITQEEVEKIFDEEWHENVQRAINVVMEKCDRLNMTPEDIIRNITDYNIDKRLNEQVFNSLVERLPKILYWEDCSQLEIFDEFKEIIDNCNACQKFNCYTAKIYYDGSEKNIHLLNFLKAVVNRDYEELHVEIIPHKVKNKLTLKIKKLSR